MDSLVLTKKENTPRVELNAQSGLMVFEGSCIPEDAHSFFVPIINWVGDFFEKNEPDRNQEFSFRIDCEYYNSASAKMLVYLFDKISEIQKTGYNFKVIWHCNQDDPDLVDSINDYTDITGVSIDIEYK